MNGSTENRAHGAWENAEPREVVLNLATARRMLPLVQRIVADIMQDQQRLASLLPEQDRLDRRRRGLTWPERSRRYQVKEEIATLEEYRREAGAELAGLGVVLLDELTGRVGFPTVVNSHRAYFSWQIGETDLQFWHFPDEISRHEIPAAWEKAANMTVSVS